MAVTGREILDYITRNDPEACADVRGLAGMVFDGADGASDAAHARVCGFFARYFESGGDPDFDFSGPDIRQPAEYARAIRALEMASAEEVHNWNNALSPGQCWSTMQGNIVREMRSGISVIRIGEEGRSDEDYAAIATVRGDLDRP